MGSSALSGPLQGSTDSRVLPMTPRVDTELCRMAIPILLTYLQWQGHYFFLRWVLDQIKLHSISSWILIILLTPLNSRINLNGSRWTWLILGPGPRLSLWSVVSVCLGLVRVYSWAQVLWYFPGRGCGGLLVALVAPWAPCLLVCVFWYSPLSSWFWVWPCDFSQ